MPVEYVRPTVDLPHTPAQIVASATAKIGSRAYEDSCELLVRTCAGLSHGAFATAQAHADAVPISLRHNFSTDSPAGAFRFWRTQGGQGHIAVVSRPGFIISNDLPVMGGPVTEVPDTEPRTRWGALELFWCAPWYPGYPTHVTPKPKPAPVPEVEDVKETLFINSSDPDPKPAWKDCGTTRREVSPAYVKALDAAAGGAGKGHAYAVLIGTDPFWTEVPPFPAPATP